MKILMVNKFLYPNGGSETYMMKLGKYLVSRGNEVQYFGMEHPDNRAFNKANAYTENMDFHSSSALKKIHMSLKTIYSVEARKKIRLVLDDFKPDVVHLNNFNYQLTPSIILEIMKWEKETASKVKIVYTAHDYQLICPNHMLYNSKGICEKCLGGSFKSCIKGRCVHSSLMKSSVAALEAEYWNKKNIYSRLDSIICCSEFIKSKLDSNPVFAEKTTVMHNFADKPEYIEPHKKDYVLYFGRYSREKGIEALLELKDISFVFAGSGPMEEEINKAKHIKNVGFKKGKELAKLISQARLTVYPSIWYENCPLSVMESIMLSTPVVASNIGGIGELVNDGETGILVEAGNIKQLGDAVKSILYDREKAEKMSAACKQCRFTAIDEYYDKITEIYNN